MILQNLDLKQKRIRETSCDIAQRRRSTFIKKDKDLSLVFENFFLLEWGDVLKLIKSCKVVHGRRTDQHVKAVRQILQPTEYSGTERGYF